MLEDMLEDPRQMRVGLIHCDKLRHNQAILKWTLVQKYHDIANIVVITHHSGHLSDETRREERVQVNGACTTHRPRLQAGTVPAHM